MFDHSHHHETHPHPAYSKAFMLGISLNSLFVIVELGYGIYADSLALIADAGHNLTDILGLLLAWAALSLTKIKPNPNYTYGLQSASIIAALANSMIIMLMMGALVFESIDRLSTPAPVNQWIVICVAMVGVFINGISAWMFHREKSQDLNIKGAYMHMAADALVSLGVVAGGIIGLNTGWLWIDPLLSLMIAFAIVAGTWSLMSGSVRLALSGVPKHVDAVAVKAYLASLDGVKEVHDLHIWALGTTETALSAHLEMPAGHPGDGFLRDAIIHLNQHFRIHHATIQIEMGNLSDAHCSHE